MQPQNTAIKLILADNQELFTDGFRLMIAHYTENEFELVAVASNGRELVEKVTECNPCLVLTSVELPEMDGWQATRLLKSRFPALPIIAISDSSEENLLLKMIQAGVKGYLVKHSSKSEFIHALKTVNNGGTYFSGCLSSRCIRRLTNILDSEKKSQFSFNEMEIIKLICKEYSSREIAGLLRLKLRTVEDYRHKIMEKMDVRNLAGVAIYAVKHEMINVSELLV